ncbi:MAG: hypothetical protein ACXW1N_07705 [Halobacteriota archaeon]
MTEILYRIGLIIGWLIGGILELALKALVRSRDKPIAEGQKEGVPPDHVRGRIHTTPATPTPPGKWKLKMVLATIASGMLLLYYFGPETETKTPPKPDRPPRQSDGVCTNTYLDSYAIRAEFIGKTVEGKRIKGSGGGVWREFIRADGTSQFVSANGSVCQGRWDIKDNRMCFCYGTCEEWTCKYVMRVAGCVESGTFYTNAASPNNVTSHIHKMYDGDVFGIGLLPQKCR